MKKSRHLKILLVLGFLERNSTDEDWMTRSAVSITDKEANTLKLEAITRLCSSKDGINKGIDDGLAGGVKISLPIRKLIRTIRLEERLVQTDFSSAWLSGSIRLRNPVDETIGLEVTLKVVLAEKLYDLAVGVLDDILACHSMAIAQTDRFARGKTPVVFLILQSEVAAVDVKLVGEFNSVGATLFLKSGMVRAGDANLLTSFKVGELNKKRVKNTHSTVATGFHKLTANLLKNSVVDEDSGVGGDTDDITEVVDNLRRVTTTTKTVDGRHTRIVPTVDKLLSNQCEELTLAHDGTSDVQAAELPHNGTINLKGIEQPEVRVTTDAELESAKGEIDILKAIVQAVSEVVGWVDAVLVAGHGVRDVADTVGDKIPHAWVIRCDIHLHTKGGFTLLETTLTHLLKELKVLTDWTVTPWAGSLVLTALGDFFAGLMADVSLATLDELNSTLVELVKAGRSVSDLPWVVTKPLNVVDDRVDVHVVLTLGVGIVKTKVTVAVVLCCKTKVQVHRLGVTDVKEAIGLRRETGDELATSASKMLLKDRGVELNVLVRHRKTQTMIDSLQCGDTLAFFALCSSSSIATFLATLLAGLGLCSFNVSSSLLTEEAENGLVKLFLDITVVGPLERLDRAETLEDAHNIISIALSEELLTDGLNGSVDCLSDLLTSDNNTDTAIPLEAGDIKVLVTDASHVLADSFDVGVADLLVCTELSNVLTMASTVSGELGSSSVEDGADGLVNGASCSLCVFNHLLESNSEVVVPQSLDGLSGCEASSDEELGVSLELAHASLEVVSSGSLSNDENRGRKSRDCTASLGGGLFAHVLLQNDKLILADFLPGLIGSL